jgi:hypothetical protein
LDIFHQNIRAIGTTAAQVISQSLTYAPERSMHGVNPALGASPTRSTATGKPISCPLPRRCDPRTAIATYMFPSRARPRRCGNWSQSRFAPWTSQSIPAPTRTT